VNAPAAILLPLVPLLVRFPRPLALPAPRHDPPDATDRALRAFARDRALRADLARHGVDAAPEASAALARLAAVAPILIVADESREVTDQVLDRTGWRDQVRRAVTLDDVEGDGGRPSPALHLAALARLVPRGRAGAVLAVEASADGVEAAHAAGIARIVVCGDRAPWNDGLPRIASLAELTPTAVRTLV
jgi:beta-phosphoglucomutase-like phosphatase (HAD superfamily)